MKRLGLGLCVLVAFSTAAAAAPALGVDVALYDFGTVAEGTVVSHGFILTNLGDDVLQITGTRATCGCTTTALAKTALAPGESVSLEARVDTSHFGGRIAKQIYVESNDPMSPTAVLTLEGQVTPVQPYNLTPSDLKYLFFLILDVRDPASYAAGHLLGAMNIPSAYLAAWTGILPRDVILVLVDNDGVESGAQAKYLQGAGFPQARSLAGGLASWNLLPTAAQYVVGALPKLAAPPIAAVEPHEIPNADLRSIYLVMIDIRDPEAYASPWGHFMGAVNIPASQLSLWQAKLPRDAEIVLYDQTGAESDRQAETFQAAGFSKLHSLAGGYDNWVRLYGITYLIAERS